MLNYDDLIGKTLQNLTPKARESVDEIARAYYSYKSKVKEDVDLLEEAVNRVLANKETLVLRFSEILDRNFSMVAQSYFPEYEYDLYEDAFRKAIYSGNIDFLDSVIFSINEKTPSRPVTVRFDRYRALGSPDSYMSAVNVVRKKAGIRGSMERRSKAWKLTIYMPAREGVVYISDRKKRSLKKKGQSIEEYIENVKATAEEKYRRIIAARLDTHGKAGFWYFLEHGNLSFRNSTGTPYPAYSARPSGFIELSVKDFEEMINREIISIYRSLLREPEGEEAKEFNEFINNLTEGITEENYNKVVKGLYLGENLKDRLVYRKSGRIGIRRRK